MNNLQEAKKRKSAQRRLQNEDMIRELAKRTTLPENEFYALLRLVKLKIDLQQTCNFLDRIFVHKPHVIVGAINKYKVERRVTHDIPKACCRQFLSFLLSTSVREEHSDLDLTNEINEITPAYDDVEDEISQKEFEYNVDLLEDDF